MIHPPPAFPAPTTVVCSPCRRMRGLGLVEVQIALLLLGLGLLAALTLQARALGWSLEARQRTAAAVHLADLAAMLQANPAYWAGAGAPVPVRRTLRADSRDLASDLACCRTRCTPQQTADCDLALWQHGLGHDPAGPGLVRARAQVNCNAGASLGLCELELAWGADAAQRMRLQVRP